MKRVCIGVHAHEQPEQLLATLESVRRNTQLPIELLLLSDGPDRVTSCTLESVGGIRQLRTADPRGAAACFNRLVSFSDADILILLESGSLVGPGWLDQILKALQADPSYGLAGPTTNRSWNEQGAFPRAGGSLAEIQRMAQAVLQRFGDTWRTLEPLHSLADFCYAVRRDVVQAVGAADEAYGLGPCWEMDYNIRAARAGFRGVWACGAYVYRSPFTARRRREEARRFTTSKHRYQDKFCGLRLRHERTDYESHCRGEECEYFAPRELIQIQIPLPDVAPPTKPVPAVSTSKTTSLVPITSSSETVPLVSCIMPTRDRLDFVLQSIRYFQRQDYPARELIIVDDSVEDLAGQLPDVPHIRYVRMPPGQSIGAKRNRACELARGDIIAHWDDDDWYAPDRLGTQIAPLLSGAADISGLDETTFFELTRWEFWRCAQSLHRRLFVEDVHGGTLVYWRRIWNKLAHYPNQSLAEDAAFLRQAVRRGARLCRIPSDDLFIYLRHAVNSWSFVCGQYLDPRGWQRVVEPSLPPADRAFYAARSHAAPVVSPGSSSEKSVAAQPLVSCIMPTANRRAFVSQAIQYFLRQDYPNRELIVVDDGTDVVADLIPPDTQIRYVRLERKHTIGAKRNLACQEAGGEIIVHWDDDDWMAPWRLSYQVASLLREQADICGLDKVLYYEPRSERSWQYVYPKGGKAWVAGNTLCYAKAFWQRNPFPEINVGEDTRFVWSNQFKKILPLQDFTFYVALIHPGNTSSKRATGNWWRSHPTGEIRDLMGEDWIFYAHLLQGENGVIRSR